MNGPEQYFILIYDIVGRTLEIHPFEDDYEAAAAAYTQFEDEHREDPRSEVVLVGADSIETIKTTHSHYFSERADDLFEQFLRTTSVEGSGRVLQRARPKTRRRGKH